MGDLLRRIVVWGFSIKRSPVELGEAEVTLRE